MNYETVNLYIPFGKKKEWRKFVSRNAEFFNGISELIIHATDQYISKKKELSNGGKFYDS